ncbi:FUSC family protein [Micromonospora globbae]|uniref:FUSC family protein n=1 Tax=Micromonospora globbae TaxID=1894969 RepID=UPI003867630B|nr:FUSC family protein [Micromonospora globbae]
MRPELLRREGRQAYERLRNYLVIAVQAGVAAGLSWFIANDVLHHSQALFAPAASIGTIAAAHGNRIRRAVELIAGVVVGVLTGQLINEVIGTGPVQTGLIVAFAISSAAVIRGNGAVMVHAGSTAVLLGTLTAEQPHLAAARTVNGLIGVLVAVAVALLVLPANPVRVVHRAAGPTLDLFARNLTAVAQALRQRDLQQAENAWQRLVAAEEERNQTVEMVAAAAEIVKLSPWRRRQVTVMRRYEHASEHLQHAYSNSREVAHWIASTVRQREPFPPSLPASIEHLGQAVRLLHRDYLAGREPNLARARACQAVEDVDRACAEELEFCGRVLASRLRLAISDVLQATGVPKAEANHTVGLSSGAT